MEHLQPNLRVVFDHPAVQGSDVAVLDAQTRSVEGEFRFLFRGDADADLEGAVDRLAEVVYFVLVVDDGDRIRVAGVDQPGDVVDVLAPFESVAQDVAVFGQASFGDQFFHDGDVVGRGSLDVDVVLERFVQDEAVMRTFGAVTVVVRSVVIVLLHRLGEDALGPLDVFRDARQVGQAQRSSVFLDQPHQIDAVKGEVVSFEVEFFLREVERLVDQVYVTCFHPFDANF